VWVGGGGRSAFVGWFLCNCRFDHKRKFSNPSMTQVWKKQNGLKTEVVCESAPTHTRRVYGSSVHLDRTLPEQCNGGDTVWPKADYLTLRRAHQSSPLFSQRICHSGREKQKREAHFGGPPNPLNKPLTVCPPPPSGARPKDKHALGWCHLTALVQPLGPQMHPRSRILVFAVCICGVLCVFFKEK
jgi:hypothetical protein